MSIVLQRSVAVGSFFTSFFLQDDDVDGEHIVAFAEEADLGKGPELIIKKLLRETSVTNGKSRVLQGHQRGRDVLCIVL